MPSKRAKFRFLTMAELIRLTQLEKSVYLDLAVAAVVEEFGDFTEQSTFRDGAPPPRKRMH